MPLKIKVVQPFAMGYALAFNKKKVSSYAEDSTPVMEWPEKVFQLIDQHVAKDEQLTTTVSSAYIRWRYADNPLSKYNFITDWENFVLIVRIKEHSFGKELRLADFVLLNEKVAPKIVAAFIRKAVARYCKTNDIRFISLSGQQFQRYKPYFGWMGLVPVRSMGPIVTLKDLNMNSNFPELLNVSNWSYSLGDMELF
jgi:hypothetical protein